MIDVSQFDCMVALNTAITGYTLSGLKPWELREKYPMGRGRASGLMKTKDGAWIKLTSYAPSHMDRLRRHMGEEINKEMVERKVAEMTRKEAVEYFVSIDVPVAPVYHVNEVVRDPHLIARGMLVDLEHPKAGKVTVPNFPIKFSETSVEIKSAAPLLGQDNKEVLMGILGYTEERLEELDRMGIIYTERR
jgi:crotonobetainyl-CoA:carnitine CoA-transferase CaiB-like acyl-CoA transferase